MIFFNRAMCFITLCTALSGYSSAQTNSPVTLNKLEAFSNPGRSWITASALSLDFGKSASVKFIKGNGIIANTEKNGGTNLVTMEEFGDVEINLDFMMTPSSTSGIYLQGRYGIKLADSWTKQTPTLADLGAVAPGSDEHEPYKGTAALTNVAKSPGLWQHLNIKFRAPVFENGQKIKNARFEAVYINGTLVQLENEVNSPAIAALYKDEKAKGPVMFQGNGGTVAFRNVTCSLLPPVQAPDYKNSLSKRRMNVVNPILLTAKSQPYLLRSFLMFNNRKRTHVISAGIPNGVNFSYDLKQGALFQIWRGQFMDVTEMWEDRGEPQLARPLGSVIPLSVTPTIAVLADKEMAWPDSIAFDDLQNKGYVLDNSRMPTFIYSYHGIDVTDKISAPNNGESLDRVITVTNAPDKLYYRLAAAPVIERLTNGVYAVGDRQYYIKIGDGNKPVIRNTKNGQELIVPIEKNTTPLTYSLIW